MTDTPDSAYTTSTNPDLPPDATPRFPWPPPEDSPILAGFAETWRQAVFQPVSFFRALPPSLALGGAVLYYLVVGILSAAIQLFWGSVLPDPDNALLDRLLGASALISPLVEFLLSPIYLLFSLLLAAAVTHLMVLILVPANRGLGRTARVYCFAYSPVLFGAVPYFGTIVAFLWMTVLSVIGIREVHHTSTARAATAVLVPIVIALLLVLIASLLLFSAGALVLD